MASSPVKPYRVVWTAPKTVEIESLALREPKAGEILIESELSLISPGTERAFLLGLDNAKTTFPTTGGYSLVGTVVAHGEGVTKPGLGARVVCAASHASHVIASAGRCVEVPTAVSSEEAAFFNLLAIAMQGVRKARLELGESVVVLGAGLIGQCAMQLARLNGGTPVVALDLNESRRRLAEQTSADIALDPSGDGLAEQLKAIVGRSSTNGGIAPQVVIEATGFPDAVLTAFRIAGWMARVVLLGSTRGNPNDVNFYRDVHKKGLTILGAHASTIPAQEAYPGHWTWEANVRLALRLIELGRLNLRPLITHRRAAQDAPQIYAQIAEWSPAVLGAILEWSA